MTDTLPAQAINAAEVIDAIEGRTLPTVTQAQIRREVSKLVLDGPNSRAWETYVDALQPIPWAPQD